MFSIVIPTRNRAPFLERLLTYCVVLKVKQPIWIADSSLTDAAGEIRDLINRVRPHLNLDLISYDPEIGIADKLNDVLCHVRTELVVLGADDDFFTPRGLQNAAEFLHANSDFSLAHGKSVTFELAPGPVYGDTLRVANYPQRSIEHSTASERLLDHLTRYSTTWYSMHRLEQLRRNMQTVAKLQMEPVSFTELLPSCLSLIQGKSKKLDVLYAVRQVHPRRNDVASVDTFDWVADSRWPVQFGRFRDRLTEELAQRDNISPDAARETVKRAFWFYLGQRLSSKWRQRYGEDRTIQRARLKEQVARRVPGVLPAWQRARSLFSGDENQLLLPALLRSSSPYHAEFMPSYRALTESQDRVRKI